MRTLILMCLVALAIPAQAGEMVVKGGDHLAVLEQSCIYFPHARKYEFTLYFNIVPDFYTLGWSRSGKVRPHHDFIYRIDFDKSPPRWSGLERTINATEICSTGVLAVRDGQDTWPRSLYGNLIGTVEYKFNVQQKRLTFTVSADMMGGGGVLHYDLIVRTYGSTYSGASGHAVIKTKGVNRNKNPDTASDRASGSQETTWGRVKALYR